VLAKVRKITLLYQSGRKRLPEDDADASKHVAILTIYK
jgi:hypothetical protein